MGNKCCKKDTTNAANDEINTHIAPESPRNIYDGLSMRELMLVIKVQSRVRGLITRNKIKAAQAYMSMKQH